MLEAVDRRDCGADVQLAVRVLRADGIWKYKHKSGKIKHTHAQYNIIAINQSYMHTTLFRVAFVTTQCF